MGRIKENEEWVRSQLCGITERLSGWIYQKENYLLHIDEMFHLPNSRRKEITRKDMERSVVDLKRLRHNMGIIIDFFDNLEDD